jgi:hypothetical protein
MLLKRVLVLYYHTALLEFLGQDVLVVFCLTESTRGFSSYRTEDCCELYLKLLVRFLFHSMTICFDICQYRQGRRTR